MGERHDLHDAAIFEGIASGTIEELLERGRTLTCEPGQVLFERGQDANELMLLREGVFELFFPIRIMGVTRELTMERKEMGDVVAWSALVSPYYCTLSGRCANRCKVVCFSRDDLLSFFDVDAQCGYLFMRNLASVIGRRVQKVQDTWIHDLQTSAVKHLES